MNTFVSYSHFDSPLVLQILGLARKSLASRPEDNVFCFSEKQRADQSFVSTFNEALSKADSILVFIGESFSPFQTMETCSALKRVGMGESVKIFVVRILGTAGAYPTIPDSISPASQFPRFDVEGHTYASVRLCAQAVVAGLGKPWHSWDDLPGNPHLFSYEKDIVKFFRDLKRLDEIDEVGGVVRDKLLQGCPTEWPEVRQWSGTTANKLDPEKVGKWREHTDRVDVTASSRLRVEVGTDDSIAVGSFVEAGPRKLLYYPKAGGRKMQVAIIVSGGIAPGVNAVIDGIVQRHHNYAIAHNIPDWINVWGIQNGLVGTDYFPGSARLLIPNRDFKTDFANPIATCDHAHEGGSIIGTSRVDELLDGPDRKARLERVVERIKPWADILYVIGGDGSMKAAHAIWTVANHEGSEQNLSVVAIPKTMDNDILWMWQSFGFLSAVEKAREVVEQLSTEVLSNPRLCIVQLFGSDSGFVVSHAVLATATGHCMAALIPELDFTMIGLATYIARRIIEAKQTIPHGLIVMAETAIPLDAELYLDEPHLELTADEKRHVRQFCQIRTSGTRIQGQTQDPLRSAALKIVSRVLKRMLPQVKIEEAMTPDWNLMRLVTNEPRHILRAIPPSSSDIITGQRLGTLAVDGAMAGYTDAMISQWLTEYVIVPLKLVILGRKRIPREGIFWKSVLAKTGQPSDLRTQVLAGPAARSTSAGSA